MASASLHNESIQVLNRRLFLASTAATATTATTAALGSPISGPIERLYREHVRREERVNATLKVDQTDSEALCEWSVEPLEEIKSHKPDTVREWAALLLAVCGPGGEDTDEDLLEVMWDHAHEVLGIP